MKLVYLIMNFMTVFVAEIILENNKEYEYIL